MTLPTPGGDRHTWGTKLNLFLQDIPLASIAGALEGYGPLANMRAGVVNVLDYDAPQDAFDDVDETGTVIFPAGTHLTDTITWRGQSIIGAGSGLTTIQGRPGQDVFRHDPALTEFERESPYISGIRIVTDDSVDASGEFPDRNGVGNAGWALDFPDGDVVAPPLTPAQAVWTDVRFSGLSTTVGGQNNSCGIYEQGHLSLAASFRKMMFDRLAYGWYQDCPRSNLASCEIARDMVLVDHIYFNGCGASWRIHNANWWVVNLPIFHAWTGAAITFASDQTVSRGSCAHLQFNGLYMETGDTAFAWEGSLVGAMLDTFTYQGTDAVTWAGDRSRWRNSAVYALDNPAVVLELTGDRNEIETSMNGASFGPGLVDDSGTGNQVWVTYYDNDSGAVTYKKPLLQGAYTTSNVSADRTFNANSTTTDELADVLGTLIDDLKNAGVIR